MQYMGHKCSSVTQGYVRAHSHIVVFGLTGRAPGWLGTLKLPGATV